MLLKIIFKPIQWLLSLVIGLAILMVLAVALAGFYVPFLAEKYLSHRTDFPTTITRSHLNLFLGEVDLWGLNIENPTRFHEPHLLMLKEFSLHLNPMSLGTDTKEIERLVLDIPEMSWVKTATGEINIDAFMEGFQGAPSYTEPGKKDPKNPNSKEATSPKILIKHLVLRIGKVHKIDYTGGSAKTREYNVNLDLDLKDVSSVADVMLPVTLALSKSGVSFLGDALKEGLPADLRDFSGALDKGTSKVLETATDALSSLKSFF